MRCFNGSVNARSHLERVWNFATCYGVIFRPHASRSSFVTLLEDKCIGTKGVQLEKAVGLRLAFRQMPPIRCCSDQFLFYLNSSVAQTAYTTWQTRRQAPSPVCRRNASKSKWSTCPWT